MAKTRAEKIEGLKEEITQHQNQIKRLMQAQREQDRKDRTRRLCQRMGLIESMLPDTITLTDEHFKSFLEKTIVTEQSRRILDGLTAQNAATATPEVVRSAARDIPAPVGKTANTAQENGEDADEDEGNGEAQTP